MRDARPDTHHYKHFPRYDGCDSEETMWRIVESLNGYEGKETHLSIEPVGWKKGSYRIRGEILAGDKKAAVLYSNSEFQREMMLKVSGDFGEGEVKTLAQGLAKIIQETNKTIVWETTPKMH